ncbi:hypothetical protein K438DRAFT_1993921 [Mycena galopus ATCC 62051]|nr:hypothetical protein K438DRAFT_1993921 [Mycena galopus ATCC 62051]
MLNDGGYRDSPDRPSREQNSPQLPLPLRLPLKFLLTMCDTASTSILLGALSLIIPNNRDTFLALGLAGPIIYLINGHRPSNKLAGIQDAIDIAEGTLKKAKEDCSINHVELMDLSTGLIE